MRTIEIQAGFDKDGAPESFGLLRLHAGRMYAVVGDTGSGKSRFIKDIEQIADGDSPTRRRVSIDGEALAPDRRALLERSLIAHVGQSMRFVLDVTVERFVAMHKLCRPCEAGLGEVLELANAITSERIRAHDGLSALSGGQTRALMVADVALICDSPVVLVDEIENAGIDKRVALEALCGADKTVLAVTHDAHTALMADERIVMKNGAVRCVRRRTAAERDTFAELESLYKTQCRLQAALREGEELAWAPHAR